MPYKPDDIPESLSILGVAFVVGVVAQYLKQKTDIQMTNASILWISLAAGFSSAVFTGILYQYTDISPALLFSLAGVAGWAGVSLLTTLAKALDLAVIKNLEKKLHIDIPEETTKKKEEIDDG